MALTLINFGSGLLMEFAQNIRITFTPAAHAVLHGAPMTLTPHHQLRMSALPGDLVVLEGCQSEFVIAARKWSISPTSETLEIVLDLPSLQPVLSVVV